jgi:hypothetical protein
VPQARNYGAGVSEITYLTDVNLPCLNVMEGKTDSGIWE